VKRNYFFASLFVRTAKSLAVLVALIGIGFCVLRYYQATLAISAAAYRPSHHLEQTLDKLKDSLLSTQQIVDSFNEGNQSTTPVIEPLHFPLVIESNDDLTQIGNELARLDQVRGKLKQSIVNRFEDRVKSIEEKLHVYAAALQSAPSTTTGSIQSPTSDPAPSPAPAAREESLFSPQLGGGEASDRRANLNERKEFLKALAGKAENADNRVTLGEAADQLDRLAKLLPEKFDAASAAEPDSPAQGPGPEQVGNTLLSERVANQLEQIRNSVRQTLLTSWTLDDVFEEAANLSLAEREKYRAALLAEQGIWLSATSRIAIALLATGLVSLLIAVFGDLVQTQLDTATNSSTVADAINSLRGSVAGAPVAESMVIAEEKRPVPVEAKFVSEEDWPAAGGS
jgi:hypothetical protein